MANEVCIVEMVKPTREDTGSSLPVMGAVITTQFVDAGVRSAALNEKTELVTIIDAGGSGFTYRLGDSSVNAAVNTAGNVALSAGGEHSIEVYNGFTHVDTAV